MRRPVIKNSRGEAVTLTPGERYHAEEMQRQVNSLCKRFPSQFRNSLGAEVDITTLTTIVKSISEQKFFEIAPADYLPVRVGEGTWSSTLSTYRSFQVGDQFETGIINTGSDNARMAKTSAGVDLLNVKVLNWAKSVGWTIFDLQQAAKAGNWDLVAALEESRKTNWDLGIQRVAFLGARGNNGVGGSTLGLLNQAGITTNTTTITKALKDMTPAELKTFQEKIVEDYRTNCNRTAWPTHFEIPESDYNGLASQASPDFPIKSTLQLLEEAFALITRQKGFKILPLAYADAAYHTDVTQIAGKQVYTLMRYDEKSIRMDIPLDYTNTLANSIDNFSFQNAAYGQFTGVLAYRPLEMMYFVY